MIVNRIFILKAISSPYIPMERDVNIASIIVLVKKLTNDIFRLILALFIACNVVSRGLSR